ncbi:MAG: hypothetical protein ACR2MQ_12955 [Gemmatimonadaceae bacterium]
MDSYTFSLALGGAGLVAMAASGFAHVGDHGGQHGGHHTGAASSHGHDVALTAAAHHQVAPHGQTGAARGHGVRSGRAAHPGASVRSALLALASPRTIFSLLVGFGLAGVVGRHFISGGLLLILAIVGALGFELALVGPMWKFLFRFASEPAASLEGSLMSEAHATSGFDVNGNGLVAVEVDGQLMQCLGTLRLSDRELGVRVHAGDRLRVEQVDAARSRCTVSYIGHARPE